MKDEEIERMSEFEESYWWFVGRRRIITEMLENQLGIKSDLKILDVGCGTGNTTLALRRFGIVYGMDYSFFALKHTIQRGIDKVVKSSPYNLPFQSKTFDVITIFDALEHIEDDLKVLKELKRILKDDGIIFITVPAFQFLWSEHDVALSHFRRYNFKSLSAVIKQAGLLNVRYSYMISFLFPFLALYRIFSKLHKNKMNPKPTLVRFPNFINNIFQYLLFCESKIIQKTNLPFGLSLAYIAKVNPAQSFYEVSYKEKE